MLQAVARNIALTGFMAAGKTVVGRRLARKLGWTFVDLDRVIETNKGLSVQAIFDVEGEVNFRTAEKEALGQTLERDRQIIALGGGAVVDPDNLRLLRTSSLLIWLKVSPGVVLQRVRSRDNRPLLRGKDKLQRIEKLAAQRESVYANADIAVETDDKPVDRIVYEILELLENQSRAENDVS